MLRFLRGWIMLEIQGGSPELCLNRLTAKDIPFWDLRRVDDFAVRICIYEAHLARAEREITRGLCVSRVLARKGFRNTFYGLKKRPVLLIGLAAALLLAAFAQNFVWFVRIEGNQNIPADRILREIAEEGVAFGAWGPGLDSQFLKNRMLNRIPELRWLAVNRDGAIAHVMVAERTPEEPRIDENGVTNVVAARAGIITELRVLNGFAAVEVGDAVTEGQLLVSGMADWTTHTQATRATAEVYADTMRKITLKTPSKYDKKTYTGRTEVCRTLIFQSFRRKISGNSGIFGMSCDKMVETKPLALPGGYALPVSVETVTLREYTRTVASLSKREAEKLLNSRARYRTETEMTAGVIRSASNTIQQEKNSYICSGELYCTELISRTVPVLLFGEDETNGKDDQRGTN